MKKLMITRNHLIVIILNLIKGVAMVTYIIVSVVLYLIQLLIIVCTNFAGGKITRKERKMQFVVGIGFILWGSILLLN